jgi:hypothetical protein
VQPYISKIIGILRCGCLLGHLPITFECSSKPTGRGAVNCAVKKWLGDILGKLDRLFFCFYSFVDGR